MGAMMAGAATTGMMTAGRGGECLVGAGNWDCDIEGSGGPGDPIPLVVGVVVLASDVVGIDIKPVTCIWVLVGAVNEGVPATVTSVILITVFVCGTSGCPKLDSQCGGPKGCTEGCSLSTLVVYRGAFFIATCRVWVVTVRVSGSE